MDIETMLLKTHHPGGGRGGFLKAPKKAGRGRSSGNKLFGALGKKK